MTYPVRQGAPIHALATVGVDILDGEFVSIVGPSGCGKSTLLKIVAGLIQPSTGAVHINGEPVETPSDSVGLVFQTPVLLPWRTIEQNVMLPADVRRSDRSNSRANAHELLNLVGLGGSEKLYPNELSGGMQQRVSIARALAQDPVLLLMDEPFGALDAMTRDHMGYELLRIWAQSRKTVIFVTHSIPEAVLLSDRIVVMSPKPGQILEILNVKIPRPRTPDVVAHPQFTTLVTRARGLLNADRSAH